MSRLPFSPLVKFVEAKNRISSIFNDVEKYVNDSRQSLKKVSQHKEQLIPNAYLVDVENFYQSVKTIQDVLRRDHMKVVFFGRTSNGKSTVINAMLYSKVLPSGMGHTTRCFIQVEASPNGEKYILVDSSQDPKSIDSIDALTHALCSTEMGEDSLVHLMWPKIDSRLLQNDVVLVDSPGIDVSPEFDSWIDKHCLDADVFVLVSNAESTLTQTEKNFFHRVNDKVSRPNIFILNNRWDASAVEPELIEKVREQHMKQFVKFLVDDLAVYSSDEAKNRVFFVSAREMLNHRLRNRGLSVSPAFTVQDGFQARMLEFEDFERQFELCISQSAIQTKFESHMAKGKHISTKVFEIMEDALLCLAKEKETRSQTYEKELASLLEAQEKYNQFMRHEKEHIQQVSAEVQLKVSAEFYEQISRLESIVDNFHRPFNDDPITVASYKQELINHVDNSLTEDLQVRCTGGLLQRIIEKERAMIEHCHEFLPESFARKSIALLQYRQPFAFSFHLHSDSLMTDFQESLQFSFSLGITRILQRFMRPKMTSFARNRNLDATGRNNAGLFGSSSFIPQHMDHGNFDSDDAEVASMMTSSQNENMVMHSVIYSSATYVANGGIGLCLIGGLVYRSIGWRILAGGITVYVLLYLYEKLSWNNRAKENSLKQQLRRHLCYKLSQQSQSLSMSCENQVTRELTEVLNRIHELSSEAHHEMKEKVETVRKEVTVLDGLSKTTAQAKNNGKFVCTELDNFWHNHLMKAFR